MTTKNNKESYSEDIINGKPIDWNGTKKTLPHAGGEDQRAEDPEDYSQEQLKRSGLGAARKGENPLGAITRRISKSNK